MERKKNDFLYILQNSDRKLLWVIILLVSITLSLWMKDYISVRNKENYIAGYYNILIDEFKGIVEKKNVYNSTNKSNGIVLNDGSWHDYNRGLLIGDSIVKEAGKYEVYYFRKDLQGNYKLNGCLYFNDKLKELVKTTKIVDSI